MAIAAVNNSGPVMALLPTIRTFRTITKELMLPTDINAKKAIAADLYTALPCIVLIRPINAKITISTISAKIITY